MIIIKHYGTAVCNVPVINKYMACASPLTHLDCAVFYVPSNTV